MKITHFKLSRKCQIGLLEFFIGETLTRRAANLLEITPNNATLFYRKLREVITYNIEY